MYMRAYCMNYNVCKQYTNITDYKNNVNPQCTHARIVCVCLSVYWHALHIYPKATAVCSHKHHNIM